MSKVKVGVIGCGSIAKYRHLPEYHTHPDVDISSVCDVVIERAQAVAQTYGAKAYTDYMDLINDKEINAVRFVFLMYCMLQWRLLPCKRESMSFVKNQWLRL